MFKSPPFDYTQILLWANTSVSACDRPYEWACGRFEADFDERSVHHGLANNGGEWTVETSAEYDGEPFILHTLFFHYCSEINI